MKIERMSLISSKVPVPVELPEVGSVVVTIVEVRDGE